MSTPIQATGLHITFAGPAGDVRVLEGVDLEVAAGELVVIAGRSGSGKTTLLLAVAGLEGIQGGAIRVLGRDADAPHPWHEVTLLPQSIGLLDELTVAENVALPGRLAGSRTPTDVEGVLQRLGLDHLGHRFPSETSLGEQQRAALARAVVHRPLVLLADEPLCHQNQEWAEIMMAVLADLAADGTACLLASHDEAAFARATRVLDLRDGRLQPRA